MGDDFALEAGVNDDERHEFDRVAAVFTPSMVAQLRTIYARQAVSMRGAWRHRMLR
jgi:hypothetical protein